MIKCPLTGLPAGNIQLLKRTAEHSYLIDIQPVPCLRLQIIQNLHGRHPFASLLFFRRTEITMEQLFQRARLLKFTVRLLQNLFILIIQPVTLTLINGFHRLSIKLFVIDGSIGFDRSYHLNTDKTTAATWIGKQIFLIAGADKGSITTHFTNSIAMRLAQVSNRLLQQMLQKPLLADIDLIKLINVDQKKTS